MNKKFTVILDCWDYDCSEPYMDRFTYLYNSFDEAMEAITNSVKDELICLNRIESDNPRKKVAIEDSDGNIIGYDYPFRADFNGDNHCIVRFWDGEDYYAVTAYNIEEITEHNKYNDKLRETYGNGITVFIEPYIEDDLSIWYKVVIKNFGEIDSFDNVEEAYKLANNYLHNL